jgi:branched-chain amino acid transport system permease protein
MSAEAKTFAHAHRFMRARERWHWAEALPWILAVAAFFILPDHMILGTQILITIIFVLSLDLILGYAGIITLGHAAYFGAGAYATGMLSAHLGWGEPLTGLLAGGLAGAVSGFLSGWVLLRYHGLTLLMLTLAVAILLQELANTLEVWTGGFDGLQGIEIQPLFGLFDYDLAGFTTYWYALVVLAICFYLSRRLVHAPFGRALAGIRENTRRMHAVGSPVHFQLVSVYTVSAAMAGVAGALFAQANAYVTLEVLSFEKSGTVLIMLILGGTGRLYGAFIGAIVYMVLEDELSKLSPEFWEFGVGITLIVVVLFFRQGLLGAFESLSRVISAKLGKAS